MKICSKCGWDNSDESDRCARCGSVLPDERDPEVKTVPASAEPAGGSKAKSGKRFIAAFVIAMLAAGLIILITANSRKGTDPDKLTRPDPGSAPQTEVTANPGGSLPTAVPSLTPTFLTGMDSPAFCKIEMAKLSDSAHKSGAEGMLTPERYEQSSMTCVFLLRSMTAMKELGHIYVIHKENEGYGLRLEITSGDEGLNIWGKTLLLSLDNSLTPEDAETAVSSAISGGSASLGVYDLSFRNMPLTGTAELSITDRTKN